LKNQNSALRKSKKLINMPQGEIEFFLQENPDEWFSCQDISYSLKRPVHNVQKNVAKLRRKKLIDFTRDCSPGIRLRFLYKARGDINGKKRTEE